MLILVVNVECEYKEIYIQAYIQIGSLKIIVMAYVSVFKASHINI